MCLFRCFRAHLRDTLPRARRSQLFTAPPRLRDTVACHDVEEVEHIRVPRPGHRLGNDDPGTCGEYCIEEAPPESVQGVKESSGEL